MNHLIYVRTWLNNSNGAAYGAALALIGVQVSIGIIMKSSQTGGHYAFSTSACIAISEFFKLILSTAFFWRECHTRRKNISGNVENLEGFQPLSNLAEARSSSESSHSTDSSLDLEKDEQDIAWIDLNEKGGVRGGLWGLGEFWENILNEVSVEVRYGFAMLSLIYALINNTVSMPWSFWGSRR
jgi:hypothetical protein